MKNRYLKALSLLLTIAMLLSLAVVNVSAYPAEYNALASETKGFESGNDGVSKATADVERSTAKAHTGSYSMKLTCNSGGNVYFNPTMQFTAGSKYYLSFWFYSDTYSKGNIIRNGGSNLTIANFAVSSSATGQWNRAWTTIECKADQTWMQFGAHETTAGDVIYIDDIEFVKVSDTTLKNNEVPTGAQVATSITKNFEGNSKTGFGDDGDGKVVVDSTIAHWGNRSLKLYNTSEEKVVRDFYFNNAKEIAPLKENTYYYLSYYVYSPNASFPHMVQTITGQQIVPNGTVIPQGQWTKISKIFTVNTATATNANSHLLKFFASNVTKDIPVYFDDFVFAELSEELAFTLTQSAIDFYSNGDAKVTLTSSVELANFDSEKITGATITGATLADDAKTVTVDLTGLSAETPYTLTFADLKDVYGRTKTVDATVTTPSASEAYMSISSSSIADGETGVLAPVSRLYIAAPYDLEGSTVTTANITLTGGATITNVSLRNSKTICVEIDGTLPDTEYELAIDNVANTSGGILKDTLSWTTGAAEKSGKAGFEINTDGISYTGSNLSIVGASTEQAKSGSKSLKINATGNTNSALNWNAWNAGYQMTNTRKDFELGKEYLVSFWIYADKNIQVRLAKHNGSNVFGLTSVTAGNWVKLSGKFAPTEAKNIGNDLFQFDIRVTGTTNYYIDDLEIKTLSNVSSPCVFKGDVPVSRIGEGDHTVEYTLKSAADKSVWSVVAQYDGNNMLKTFAHDTRTVTAGANTVVTVTVAGAKNLKTKLLVMDSTSYAPQCDARIIKNN